MTSLTKQKALALPVDLAPGSSLPKQSANVPTPSM